MFYSVDIDGMVVQNTVTDAKLFLYANDNVIFDPKKDSQLPRQVVVAPRMSSSKFPMEFDDDNVTIVAVGSEYQVQILLSPEK